MGLVFFEDLDLVGFFCLSACTCFFLGLNLDEFADGVDLEASFFRVPRLCLNA